MLPADSAKANTMKRILVIDDDLKLWKCYQSMLQAASALGASCALAEPFDPARSAERCRGIGHIVMNSNRTFPLRQKPWSLAFWRPPVQAPDDRDDGIDPGFTISVESCGCLDQRLAHCMK